MGDPAPADEQQPQCCAPEASTCKVTPVIKLRNEALDTPVSSGGEDDDARDFFEVLKDDPTWQPPPDDVILKISSLLDMYFSDENLLKDKFLLKHVKRNRLGYVSVKLLTSFKKLKSLSHSDWMLTAYCISKSDKLELNKSGTKVRRKEPLPDIDLPTTSIKTILYKLPTDCEEPAIDTVSERFQVYGKLTTVRIIQPGKDVPLDLRNHTSKHPELGTHPCVVIEFESTEDAQTAYKALSKEARIDNRLDMFSMLGSGRNPKKQAAKSFGRRGDGHVYDSADESSPCVSSREGSPMMRRKFMNGVRINSRGSSPLVSPQGSRDVSPERLNGSPWTGRKRGESATPESNPRSSPLMSRNQHLKKFPSPLAVSPSTNSMLTPESGSPASSSPWLQRRRQFVASQGNSPSSTPGSSPLMGRKFHGDGVPVGVSRLPRGPPSNTSKGFDSGGARGGGKLDNDVESLHSNVSDRLKVK